MPSNQTANYALSQWVKSDQVRMEDFNADNAKLDAALKAAEQRSAGLDAKIDAAAATAEQRSAARAAALDAAKGNCTVEFFSYVGQGNTNPLGSASITFREPPLFFFVIGYYAMAVGSKHSGDLMIASSGGVLPGKGSWSGNTLTFTPARDDHRLDMVNKTYYVFAFYAAG